MLNVKHHPAGVGVDMEFNHGLDDAADAANSRAIWPDPSKATLTYVCHRPAAGRMDRYPAGYVVLAVFEHGGLHIGLSERHRGRRLWQECGGGGLKRGVFVELCRKFNGVDGTHALARKRLMDGLESGF